MGNYDGIWPPPALVPQAYTYDADGNIAGEAHNTTVAENGNGTFGWECSCGDEADEFEDYDAADTDSDEHRNAHADRRG